MVQNVDGKNTEQLHTYVSISHVHGEFLAKSYHSTLLQQFLVCIGMTQLSSLVIKILRS